MVINDEAHHIHDESLAWYKSIQDINNKLKYKGSHLSLQIDVTATPKHTNGAIFAQTISDYPLVEAITQNVVKQPVAPDGPSRTKLTEHQSSKFSERYSDYLRLGVEEWQKSYDHHLKLDRKAVLFIMTDDTKNCDEVKDWLELNYKDLTGAVLVIHTNKQGEISESTSGANKKELEELRKQANQIDSFESPYKAIVSVLMLKEGWDVQNVTTIVGLRAFSSTAKILPEQTLGRGLRRMYRGRDDLIEKVRLEIHQLRSSDDLVSTNSENDSTYELLRAVSEILRNVSEHAQASRLTIEISDNGIGGAQSKEGSFGLLGLSERISRLHGDIHIDSSEIGTRIRIEIPLER
jgi:superfamily II DNA or RNA helicase